MNKPMYYWIGFVVSIFLSVRYLILNGINVSSILVVIIIQVVYQVFVMVVRNVRKE